MNDLEIVQNHRMVNIKQIASKLGINEENLELYGNYKAKVNLTFKGNKNGKLILVTSINPTSAGEGKSTVTIGLGDALSKLNYKTCITLRQPSFGPVLGIKGGATGGGYSQVLPMEDINLGLTGDFYAIELANNTVSAMIDNHIYQGNKLKIDPTKIIWHRVMDMNDRALRGCVVGLGGTKNGHPREEHFDITAASEIMAILCLAKDLDDLRIRIDRTVVAYSYDREPITIKDLGITGSLLMILKDAIKPNLVQSLEGTPCLIHGGPFANIAHGCNSLIATKMAMSISDFTVTEAGFGADLGAEKFFDIKCQEGNITPSISVIVTTLRALKLHGGVDKDILNEENIEAINKGISNLEHHLNSIKKFGIPYVIALNKFESDYESEIDTLINWARNNNHPIEISSSWSNGSDGALNLAKIVIDEIKIKDNSFKPLYNKNMSLKKKIETICKEMYNASKITYSSEAKLEISRLSKLGYDKALICMAKTQYSISDNPKLLGCPKDNEINIKSITPAIGAGFIVVCCSDIMRMPGLPNEPAALNMDLVEGKVKGLF